MYSESLYLLLALATFVSFERKRWTPAAICAFLLILSRPTGVIILPCLGMLLIQRRPQGLRPWLPLVTGSLALVAFGLYQWVTFGTPLASIRAQAVAPWSRTLSQAMSDLALHGRPGMSPLFLAVELVIALCFVALVPLVYRRFGPVYALFAALSVLVPASSGLISMERFVIVDFPVFAAVACGRWKMLRVGLLIAGFYALLLFMALFVDGYSIF